MVLEIDSHCLSSILSFLTLLLLCHLHAFFPVTNEKYHKKESKEEENIKKKNQEQIQFDIEVKFYRFSVKVT